MTNMIATALPTRRLAFSRSWALRCRSSEWTPRSTRAPFYVENIVAGDTLVRDWAGFPRDAAAVVRAIGGSYDPLRIAHFALVEHARYARTGDPAALASFFAQAGWLRDAVRAGADGALPMPCANPRYKAPAGHLSATTQGLAISALLRANEIDATGGFLDAALQASLPFRSAIEDGGVVWRSAAGDTFFEDVAVLPGGHGLRGFLLAFVGIFELQRRTQSEWLGRLVGASIATLQRRLGYFDAGYWSFEDACVRPRGERNLAPLRVHDSNAALLFVCASMTGERYFEETARAWRARADDLGARRRLMRAAFPALTSAHGSRAANDWAWSAF